MDETLNGTNESQENPQPRKLSRKEKAEVEKNRQQFRAIHDAISELDIYEAEAVLGMVSGSVVNAYQNYQEKVGLKELVLAGIDEKAQRIVDICSDLDVQRVLTYTNALHNAINRHKYVKTKDWTVKDLDIELL